MATPKRRPFVSRPSKLRQESRNRLRRSLVETLEQRQLLAAGPQLISINPNEGEIFASGGSAVAVPAPNRLGVAPTELTFRFDGNQTLDLDTLAEGIRITRSLDGEFGNDADGDGVVDDEIIRPGFVGFGESEYVVIARFAEPLPDGVYRIDIVGFDDPGRGLTALRNVAGEPFEPARIGGVEVDGINDGKQTVFFELELGAKIIAIVPQPIDIVGGNRVPRSQEIDVYFDQAELFDHASVTDAANYQLLRTEDTVSLRDDVDLSSRITSIVADRDAKKVTLRFDAPIDQLPGSGTFRLRIGNDETVAVPVTSHTPSSEPGGTVFGAHQLPGGADVNGRFAMQVSQSIVGTGLGLDFPGGVNEPGHRDIQEDGNGDESHFPFGISPDTRSGITRVEYNFSEGDAFGTSAQGKSYGKDAFGNPLYNRMTPEQKQRVREVFDFYGAMLGIDVIETVDSGMTVVLGDLHPAGGDRNISQAGGVSGVTRIGSGGDPNDALVIFDGAETWYDNFGFNLTGDRGPSLFEEAFGLIGLALNLRHSHDLPPGGMLGEESEFLGNAFREWVFPGQADVVHGQHLYRPDNRDIDFYRFSVADGVEGTLTLETLAERLPDSSRLDTHLSLFRVQEDGGVTLVASNNDYFSNDSFIHLDQLGSGEYIVGVTAKGNEQYNPEIADTGSGGVSEGNYELRIDFRPQATTIVDAAGTQFDGDRDGSPGGVYNFWFQANAPAAAGETAQGSNATRPPRTLFVDKAASAGGDGSLSAPFRNIDDAVSVSKSGDVVRVLGNGGDDGDLFTPEDAEAYQVGEIPALNRTLDDGLNVEVKAGVTLMIDAGAVLKMLGSRISVGSGRDAIDRSGGSIQVLGRPELPVFFTSFNDPTQGKQVNPLDSTPGRGDWGGIEIRRDIDRAEGRTDLERQGIFLDYVNHADLQYGGGRVWVGSNQPVINPIHLAAARPEISYNTITRSADAAISADPNSFEETTFAEPRYQLVQRFVPDYGRVGPQVQGNVLVTNTTNGMFVRTETAAGGRLKQLEVPGRFDDTDIVHVLGENLLVRGSVGGPVLETLRPNTLLTNTVSTSVAGGGLSDGTYHYRISFVDAAGGEGRASDAFAGTVASGDNALRLRSLPQANRDFVSRRLYRSTNGPSGTFELVAELDGQSRTYVDSLGTPLTDAGGAVNPLAKNHRGRLDARLAIDAGVVVKTEGARIETGVGADLYAEGVEGRPVIFTSRGDDRYGAGSTFDTNDDGSSAGTAADWGGIYAGPLGTISIDHATIAHAGGVAGVEGTFAGFNALEIHQAEARIAHTVFENNAAGQGGQAGAGRQGRGPNDASILYVVGSQPALLENVFRDNTVGGPAAISINANALTAGGRQDFGRHTGLADRIEVPPGNVGPLVRGNALANNSLNGLRVRGETLQTETVWDDTDIVHILQNEVIVPDLHTYGGLRLQSNGTESLVVKLGGGAGLTATGRPLDITDRIGGRIQVLGTPGFPVVMTSLADDSVGAGFDPLGAALVDTNNNGSASQPAPGDWRSILLDSYSHDRNVATITETEGSVVVSQRSNGVPDRAEVLGQLAPSEKDGDETRRLGFTVHGSIADSADVDVYSFTALPGTLVWFDLDQTRADLDSVVELIDRNGKILVLSDQSGDEAAAGSLTHVDPSFAEGHALPMRKNPQAPLNANGSYRDLYSTNPSDAAMRIVLPGSGDELANYYVRVRSSNVGPDVAAGDYLDTITDPGRVRDGLSHGTYQLQVRLQEIDEHGGSTVRYADIRYASAGIEARGLPGHSPLTGEIGLDESVAVTELGNLASSDRAAISVAARLSGASDVDVVAFSVTRDSTNLPGDLSHIGVTFDIDYADGLGRPNTSMWLFRESGQGAELVMTSFDSNVADDRATPNSGANLEDLSRGSVGPKDAFIGTQELTSGRYYLVVTSNGRMATELDQFFVADPANPLARMEPINSIQRIVHDELSFSGSGSSNRATASRPKQVAFDQNAAVPWHLGDTTLFAVEHRGNGSRLVMLNPYTGRLDARVSEFNRVEALALRSNGRLFGYTTPVGVRNDDNTGVYLQIDTAGNVGTAAVGSSGIQTYEAVIDFNDIEDEEDDDASVERAATFGDTRDGVGMAFHALADYKVGFDDDPPEILFGVASRGNASDGSATYQGVANPAADPLNGGTGNPNVVDLPAANYVYVLNPVTGAAVSFNGIDREDDARATGAGTQIRERTHIPAEGLVTGLAQLGNMLYAVSDRGEMFRMRIDPNDNLALVQVYEPQQIHGPDGIKDENGDTIAFTGLTVGPRSVDGGQYQNLLFGTAENGRVYVMNTLGELQNVLHLGASSVDAGEYRDLDFSNLDTNLWHLTNRRGGDAGHGSNAAFDGSRTGTANGGVSYYFGLEDPDSSGHVQSGNWGGSYDPKAAAGGAAQIGTYNLPGGAHGALQSRTIDLVGYSKEDRPTLYFNYFLESENANSDLNDSDEMRDALRVYVAGESGQWSLVATNNSEFDRDYSESEDEVDRRISRYTDGTATFTQEMFDNSDSWRQARVALDPWAGEKNVRIRIEFNTAGELRPDQSEMRVLAGDEISDASRFSARNLASGVTQEFEFDHGLVLSFPSGAAIPEGAEVRERTSMETLIRFTQDSTDTAPEAVFYRPTDTAALIAMRVWENLDSRSSVDPQLTPSSSENLPHVVALPKAEQRYETAGGLRSGVIIGQPGVATNSVRVPITLASTRADVRAVTQTALESTFNLVTPEIGFETFPTVGADAIRFYNFEVKAGTTPFTLVNPGEMPGHQFGAYTGDLDEHSQRGQNNNFEGVYIDDIIIGFAERGEMVTGSRSLGAGNFDALFGPNLYQIQEINSGEYQLEIRTSAEYGATVPERYPQKGFARSSYDTNDRISEGISIRVLASGAGVADGATFTLSNGIDVVTFEFDEIESPGTVAQGNVAIRFSSTMTADQVAASLRNAINSVQNTLGIAAGSSDGNASGTSALVHLHGPVAFDRLGSTTLVLNAPAESPFSTVPGVLQSVVFGRNEIAGEDHGDANRHRDQGQVVLESNVIRDSLEFGIIVDAGDRSPSGSNDRSDLEGARPRPGAPRNLPILNTTGEVPGVVVMNNVLAENRQGGVRVSGDSDTSHGAPRPFARVVNNTVYGVGSGDVGIDVEQNASPTLINNIVANLETGIRVSADSSSTVIGATLYADNGTHVSGPVGLGDFAINLDSLPASQQQLFVDAAADNFYLAPGSRAIDSSVEATDERFSLDRVKEAVGIDPSPILAPNLDVTGQRRVDDPTVNAPAGQGANIFKDRGAIDRADFVGPEARMLNPLDNDGDGQDRDRSLTRINPTESVFESFTIQLLEPFGTGPDASTVTSDAVVVTENGRLLVDGVDYIFGYSPSSREIRLTPLSGIWRPDAVYEITLNNRDRFVITAPEVENVADGDQLTLTDANGIEATFEFETGIVASIPQSLTLIVPENGGSEIADGEVFTITFDDPTTGPVSETFEFDRGSSSSSENVRIGISATDTAQQVRDAIAAAIATVEARLNLALNTSTSVATNEIHLGSLASHSLTTDATNVAQAGIAGGVADGDEIVLDDNGTPVTIVFSTGESAVSGDVVVDFDRSDTHAEIGQALAEALSAAGLGLDEAIHLSDGVVQIGGLEGQSIDAGSTAIVFTGSPGVTDSHVLTVPGDGDGGNTLTAGETFSIRFGSTTQVFEFDDLSDSESPTLGNRAIGFRPGDAPETVAEEIRRVIAGTGLELTPAAPGDGTVRLNETVGHVVDVSDSSLQLEGIAGGAFAIRVQPVGLASSDVAFQIVEAINSVGSPFVGQASIRGGDTIFFDNLDADSAFSQIGGIRDVAGNLLQPNRPDRDTKFTILMPGVELDYGDAPNSYGTTLAADGARHVIVAGGPLLGMPTGEQNVSSDANGPQNGTGQEDTFDNGVEFGDSVFNAASAAAGFPAELTIYATERGFVDAWMDWNIDGDFDDLGEQIATNLAVVPGANSLTVFTPASAAIGTSYARFRISSAGHLDPTGAAIGGEVEDYTFEIVPGQPPEASDDEYDATEDETLVVGSADGVLANDSDPDGDAIQIVELQGIANDLDASDFPVTAQLTHGTLVLASDGSFEYTPDAEFFGTDSFAYRLEDQRGAKSATFATVTINVEAVNDPPQAVDPSGVFEMPEDGSLFIPWETLTAASHAGAEGADSPFNEDDQQLDVVDVTITVGGQDVTVENRPRDVTDGPAGGVMLRSSNSFQGTVEFTFAVRDDGAPPETSPQVATATVTVMAVNDPPTFTPGDDIDVVEDSGSFSQTWATDISPGPADEVAEGQTVEFDVAIDDADRDKFSSLPTLSDEGVLQFTPADNAFGDVDIVITARDSEGAASEPYTLSLSIAPVNDVPTAVGDEFDTDEDTVLTLDVADLLENASDDDLPDDELSITELSATSDLGASVTLSADGASVVYDPTDAEPIQELRPGETATDTFTYRVIDSEGATSDLVTVTVNVDGSNDAPVALPDQFSVHPSQATTISPLDNDTDVDGTIDLGSLVVTMQPSSGTIRVNSDGTLTYTPFENPGETDRLRYAVRDDLGQFSEATEIELLVNPPPVTQPDMAVTFRNESVDIAVLANDDDENGSIDASTVEIISAPRNGEAVVNNDGTITYQPGKDFFGNDSFTYRVSDDQGAASSTARVDLRVIASRLQNPTNPLDVDDSNQVSPIDALLVINFINRRSSNGSDLPTSGPPYYDVDGNGRIAPLDALQVINALNRSTRVSGEGESLGAVDSSSRFASPLSDAPASRSATEDASLLEDGDRARTAAGLDQAFTSMGELRRDPLDELLDDLTKQQDDPSDDAMLALDAVWSDFTNLE